MRLFKVIVILAIILLVSSVSFRNEEVMVEKRINKLEFRLENAVLKHDSLVYRYEELDPKYWRDSIDTKQLVILEYELDKLQRELKTLKHLTYDKRVN